MTRESHESSFTNTLFPIFFFCLISVTTLTKQFPAKDSEAEENADMCQFNCSLVYDPVCGMVRKENGNTSTKIYQNGCTLGRINCQRASKSSVIEKVPEKLCGLNTQVLQNGRRTVFTNLVGAYQACNHTCPTYCTDTYDPACAYISYPGMLRKEPRTMVNHCHVDLFSCSMGLNVTLESLNRCFLKPMQLMFMTQVAGLKSLRLLEEADHEPRRAMAQRSWRALVEKNLAEQKQNRRKLK